MAVRALIADDSLFARNVVRLHLERFGCQIVGEAENGAQAIALFRALQPDIVTLDVIMPHVDGIDALTAFRLIRKESPKTPIVVVTAVPFDKIRDTYVAEGALAYLVKPFSKYYFDQLKRKLDPLFPEMKLPLHSPIKDA